MAKQSKKTTQRQQYKLKLLGAGLLVAFSVSHVVAAGLSAREKLIEPRIKPIGEVTVGAAVAAAPAAGGKLAADAGEKRYKATCHLCHTPGVGGAPKIGDAAAWKKRKADGMKVVYERAIKGYKGMPPKGSCMTCSDAEIKAAVDYMLKKSQ